MKKTFESKSFAANTFAAGAWRGVGAAATIVGQWSDVERIRADRSRVAVHADRSRTAIHADRGRIEVQG